MSAGEVRYGAQIPLIFTVKDQDGNIVNVSLASAKKIYFTKPTGVAFNQNASFVNSGTDGQIQYVTGALDLDTIGIWYAQASVTLSGIEYKSDIQSFEVFPNL